MTGLRVVQWATGNIGSRSLRHIIEHPGLTLAGVYVTSAAKAGQDAGELCGLPPTGVAATTIVLSNLMVAQARTAVVKLPVM